MQVLQARHLHHGNMILRLSCLYLLQVGDPFAPPPSAHVATTSADPFAVPSGGGAHTAAPPLRGMPVGPSGALPEDMFSVGLGLGSGPAPHSAPAADAGLGFGALPGAAAAAPVAAPAPAAAPGGFAAWSSPAPAAPAALAPVPVPSQVSSKHGRITFGLGCRMHSLSRSCMLIACEANLTRTGIAVQSSPLPAAAAPPTPGALRHFNDVHYFVAGWANRWESLPQ